MTRHIAQKLVVLEYFRKALEGHANAYMLTSVLESCCEKVKDFVQEFGVPLEQIADILIVQFWDLLSGKRLALCVWKQIVQQEKLQTLCLRQIHPMSIHTLRQEHKRSLKLSASKLLSLVHHLPSRRRGRGLRWRPRASALATR